MITITSVLAVNGVLLLMLLSFGETARYLLKVKVNSLVEQIVLSLSIGTAIIPLLSLVLTFFKMLVMPVVNLVTCVLAAFSLYSFKRCFNHSLSIHAFLLLFITSASWMFRFIPTIGMHTHPGDDPKMHTLLAKLIVDEQGYPSSWGKYAPAGLQDTPITYQTGFHSIIAFTHLLTFRIVPITQVVFLTSQFYSWILTPAFYLFTSSFFGNKKAGIISALLSSIFPYPLIAIGYGGNARLPALFMLLASMPLVKKVRFDSSYKQLLALLVMGISMIHVGVLVFFLLLTLPITLNCIIRKRKPTCLTWIAPSFLLIALTKHEVIQSFFHFKASFSEEFSVKWWIYDLSNIMTTFSDTLSLRLISPIHFFNLVIIMVNAAIFITLFLLKRAGNYTFYLGYWILLVLLLFNNPAGPYFIRFPGWYIFTPGILIEWILIVNLIAISLIFSEMSPRRRALRFFGRLFFIASSVLLVISDLWYISWVRENGDPITTADLKAFEWIKTNISEESTFLVTDCDAGQYIPVFCERRAIPTFINFQGELMLNEALWDEMYLISGFHEGKIHKLIQTNPDASETFQLLKKYGVKYIYIGSNRIYGRTFNWSLVERSPKFKKIYEDDGVKIYEIPYLP